ncbi:hypothetical protein [Bacteroides congonensis]|jgi:hypothetical protein|uniref:hypothetical protein n=1 Tax=Bacteroides congonensis TaxID=1871006 RepID=UPI002674480D|nr:hypothetical protein [Bacteroides congonensis]
MKRFASHYLLIPDVGFMKQQVVEINDEGIAQGIFPLTEEIESVEWMPGVIVLLSARQYNLSGTDCTDYTVFSYFKPCNPCNPCLINSLNEHLHEMERRGEALLPYLFYPFDFISMQPVDGTRHRLLR